MQLLKIGLVILSVALTAKGAVALGTHVEPKVPANVERTGSQWITTPDGCSYSRAKAPGYAEQWILIIYPHHIGKPNAHVNCAPALRG